MTQSANAASSNREGGHVEEFQFRHKLARDFFDDFHRIGTLNLVAVSFADNWTGPSHRPFVSLQLDPAVAGFRVKLDPVVYRRATDDIEQLSFEVKENHIANDISVVITRNKLFRPVWFKTLEAVHAQPGKKLQCVRPLNVHVGHVVRLVVENTSLLPCNLLVSPV